MQGWHPKAKRGVRLAPKSAVPARRTFWQVDGIDVRVPLLIIVSLGVLIGMGLAQNQLQLNAPASSGAALVGTASVIDGDTIELHGKRIRLDGIDAPEGRQSCVRNGARLPCGRHAALHLSDRIGRRPVSCDAPRHGPLWPHARDLLRGGGGPHYKRSYPAPASNPACRGHLHIPTQDVAFAPFRRS